MITCTYTVSSLVSPKRRGQRGFTLLEIAITIGILAVVFTGIFALLGQGNVAHRNALARTQAAQFAASVFDDMALRMADPDSPYQDDDGNGILDGWEDRNANQIEDRFEAIGGKPPAINRMPSMRGFDFDPELQYSRDDPRQVFVTCYIYWQDEQAGIRRIPYYRVLYLK